MTFVSFVSTDREIAETIMEHSNKASERSEMSDVALASVLIREIVPTNGGATIRARILATARKLGWRYNRARDVWYEQARRIDAREMDQLRAAKEVRRLQEASDEYRELRARIARLEAALLAKDASFYRPQIDALEQSLRGLGGVDLPRNAGGSR